MKIFMRILGVAILIAIGIGFYYRLTDDELTGDRIIGIAVLASAFILMPIFLVVRWRGKRLEDYTLSESFTCACAVDNENARTERLKRINFFMVEICIKIPHFQFFQS